jgi:hypothetical protein
VRLVAVGLLITIKPPCLHKFVSLQTCYAATQSRFLDNITKPSASRSFPAMRGTGRRFGTQCDSGRFVGTWQAPASAFFTKILQARIPHDFKPSQVVHDLNARSPDGRRPTLQIMGLLRMLHAAPANVASELH